MSPAARKAWKNAKEIERACGRECEEGDGMVSRMARHKREATKYGCAMRWKISHSGGDANAQWAGVKAVNTCIAGTSAVLIGS
jgi:hypothetical protein